MSLERKLGFFGRIRNNFLTYAFLGALSVFSCSGEPVTDNNSREACSNGRVLVDGECQWPSEDAGYDTRDETMEEGLCSVTELENLIICINEYHCYDIDGYLILNCAEDNCANEMETLQTENGACYGCFMENLDQELGNMAYTCTH